MSAAVTTAAFGAFMVVENRPDASTAIGTEAVCRAGPDGNTLLLTNDALIIAKHVRPSLAYDPVKSFEAICVLASERAGGGRRQ